jgi:hypothetical protein
MARARPPGNAGPGPAGGPAYNEGSLSTPELDIELRTILREEVFPEHIETEFERIMQAVFAV